MLEETNAWHRFRPVTLEALPRQLQHALACIHAIDINSRMPPQQFAKKSSIPLPDDKRTLWGQDIVETGDSAMLEMIAERDPLQRPIPGSDRVEAHALKATNASSGVSKTRSAMAVR